MFYCEMEKVEWCYKNCGDCTKCNGMKDGKKCGYYPGNDAINELKQWDNDLISAGLDPKYITKIDMERKETLARIAKNGININIFYKKGRTALKQEKIEYLYRLLKMGVSEQYIDELAGSKITPTKIQEAYWKMEFRDLPKNVNYDKALKAVIEKIEENDKKIKTRPLDKKQQNEIDRMKALGVDTKEYEKNTIKPGILREIRLGFEHGIDPTVYYRKGHKLRQWQCMQVRLALETKLPDSVIEQINDKDMRPIDMASMRMWYSDVDEEDRQFALQKYGTRYIDDMLLRRILMLPNVKKFPKIRDAVLKDYSVIPLNCGSSDNWCREEYESVEVHPIYSNFEFIFRMLIVQNMEINTNEDVDKCINLIKEFNIYYRKVCRDFYDLSEMSRELECEMNDEERVDVKCDQINQFFSKHLNVNLQEACKILDKYKNANEYNLEGNIFLDFDTAYTNNKHVVWNKFC